VHRYCLLIKNHTPPDHGLVTRQHYVLVWYILPSLRNFRTLNLTGGSSLNQASPLPKALIAGAI